jgi:hypothetical protein
MESTTTPTVTKHSSSIVLRQTVLWGYVFGDIVNGFFSIDFVCYYDVGKSPEMQPKDADWT